LDDIPRIRERIDEIDQKLVLLLKDRYENARLLGRIKRARGIAPRDPEREKFILRKVQDSVARLGLEPKLTLPIFKAVFNFSVQAQRVTADNSAVALERKKILIVGGTGGMGRLFANFASVHGASVKIVGRTTQRTQKVAKEMELEPGSISDGISSDIVVVAVPMESVVESSIEVAQSMREGALLTDLSSVKTRIADRISSEVPSGVEYVSIHPLFGPGIDHLSGQKIAAVPFKTGPQWRSFSRFLRKAGARISLMSSEDHDRVMGYVQALHHFALLSLGVALREWDGGLKTTSIAGTIDRIEGLLRNWDTVVGIQKLNPSSTVVRRKFIETCLQLVGMQQSDVSDVERTLRFNVQKWSRKL
jgi:chorismate mutase / prephenate dehydrogenase